MPVPLVIQLEMASRRWMVRYYLRSRCDCPCLLERWKSSLPKGFAIVIVAGALSTIVTLIDVFRNKYAVDFNGYGVSPGFGLILALIASIAVVTGLLAMSGGKITKGTFEELVESGKGFAQSVGRVTTSTVKTAVNEIKKKHTNNNWGTSWSTSWNKDPKSIWTIRLDSPGLARVIFWSLFFK